MWTLLDNLPVAKERSFTPVITFIEFDHEEAVLSVCRLWGFVQMSHSGPAQPRMAFWASHTFTIHRLPTFFSTV